MLYWKKCVFYFDEKQKTIKWKIKLNLYIIIIITIFIIIQSFYVYVSLYYINQNNNKNLIYFGKQFEWNSNEIQIWNKN